MVASVGSSGLDVNGIVQQLMAVERQSVNKLNKTEASYQAKLSAFGQIKGALSAFQAAVQGISLASKFQALTATSSDPTIFTATTASTAVAGSYSLDVLSLAQSQKLVAAGQTSTTAAIGTGAATTVTIDLGTISGGAFNAVTGTYTGAAYTSNGAGAKTITIDATNNSLQGMRDAINAAGMGVTASIVNDGSGTPYRLTLSSNSTGASNSMKVTVTGDAAVSGLLANDPAAVQNMSQTMAAQNANFKVNGVAISQNTNVVSNAIPGVTLTLNKLTTTPATLTVASDTAAITTAISGFVKAYNDLSAQLKASSSYDPVAKKGAILQGDSTIRTLQTQLRSALSYPVTGISGTSALTNLTQIGITFQKDGTLALDNAKLSTAMTSNFKDIANLFASVGSTTDSLVGFGSAGTATKPGNYAVNVSQLATQGSAVGSAAANTVITAGVNDTLSLNINGVISGVTLAAGTYTAASLAAAVQSTINGSSVYSASGVSVSVTQTAGVLTMTANNFGSASSVAILGGNGAAGLMGAAPVQTAGVDVAGTIDGITATGSGQMLKATLGSPTGLSLVVNGGALGARGSVNYTQGYAATLTQWATSSLAIDGILTSHTNGIDKTIADIGNRRTQMETRLVGVEARYRKQFTSLDAMLSSMNTTSTFLTQQLAKL